MQVNDFVTIKADTNKLVYIVKEINNNVCILKGMSYRVIRNENINLLELATPDQIKKEEQFERNTLLNLVNKKERTKKKYLLGKILHIDGDEEYLNKCLNLYDELGIYAYGECIFEKEMSTKIKDIVLRINPDVIVITGHDLYNDKGYKPIDNYTNTKYFVETIKEIRKIKSSCSIVAGACQSNYEALIACGADFASSPERINIHTFDPAIIAIKIATTSFVQEVNINDILKYIENGRKAFGGVQTLGKMKLML